VTCVTLTWTLPKLEKVRKTTNIVRAYIFSIFSVLVCIPEGTHQNRIVKKYHKILFEEWNPLSAFLVKLGLY